jgi:saposin
MCSVARLAFVLALAIAASSIEVAESRDFNIFGKLSIY